MQKVTHEYGKNIRKKKTKMTEYTQVLIPKKEINAMRDTVKAEISLQYCYGKEISTLEQQNCKLTVVKHVRERKPR